MDDLRGHPTEVRTIKLVIAGITGALLGCLFFGFFIVAPLHTIKTVVLIACFGLGVLLFAGIAISLVRGDDDYV